MGDYSAIRPGTDLSQLARDLPRMHHAVIGGGRVDSGTAAPYCRIKSQLHRPRALVKRSRSRVLGYGRDPDRESRRDPDDENRRDPDHENRLVRAEISRLRRAIGVLVSTHPYRLAAGVTLEVVDG